MHPEKFNTLGKQVAFLSSSGDGIESGRPARYNTPSDLLEKPLTLISVEYLSTWHLMILLVSSRVTYIPSLCHFPSANDWPAATAPTCHVEGELQLLMNMHLAA